ncbi:MAG: TlyA family RNA methyltransferase [Deltaproteobacteria bacterium]|nr:TlyA family RNA methyltransferase [Deltaproteobacteria bacterium]
MSSKIAKKKKVRLDLLLVERGVVATAKEAEGLILSGQVRVAGTPLSKVGMPVDPDAILEIKGKQAFASRGGLKLAAALDAFSVSARAKICADVGCSSGGFTDVLIQGGAAKVFAIDVGYGDLAWHLRSNPNVVVMERTNATQLQSLPETIDLISIDVSLLSLRKVLPVVKHWLSANGEIVALVKPQYEARPDQLPEGAVIEDAAVHTEIVTALLEFCAAEGLFAHGLIASPIRGMGGNKEFLVHLNKESQGAFSVPQLIQ